MDVRTFDTPEPKDRPAPSDGPPPKKAWGSEFLGNWLGMACDPVLELCRFERVPTCQVRVARFYKSSSPPPSFLPSSFLPSFLPSCLPAFLPSCLPASLPSSLPPFLPDSLPPFLPASFPPFLPSSLPPFLPSFLPSSLTPDRTGHCRAPTASCRSHQWGGPDLHGHCQTSTGSARLQWALADLNRERPIAVGTAGPEPIYMPHRTPATHVKSICQIVGQNKHQVYVSERIPNRMPDRMPDEMTDRMSEHTSVKMSERMSKCRSIFEISLGWFAIFL